MTAACTEGTESDAAGGAPEVVIRPPVASWTSLLASRGDEPASTFRRELGLPEQGMVIMSGHQAQVWHPGILAKLLAIRAAADRFGATAAWVVVDHDENDPLTIRAPYIGQDGRLGVAVFGPRDAGGEHVPACRRPAWRAEGAWDLPARAKHASTGVAAGLQRIQQALRSSAGSEDAAVQAAAASFELATPLTKLPILLLATQLAKTTLFAELVALMKRDPAACVQAHNAAVSAFPRERIAPLAVEAARLELPLWSIGTAAGSQRRRVYSTDLEDAVGLLAPRALLLTGLMRLAGCDLFVHGLGGERYDRITELWFEKWLGKRLVPTTMVTATLRLRIPGCWPSAETIARTAWIAHRARHDPKLFGDQQRAEQKAVLLARIASAPYGSRDRAQHFAELHQLLREAERVHQAELEDLDRKAAEMGARSGEAAVAQDRTWPFPLYEADQLESLKSAIEAHFAG
jgi:hypothetical protein